VACVPPHLVANGLPVLVRHEAVLREHIVVRAESWRACTGRIATEGSPLLLILRLLIAKAWPATPPIELQDIAKSLCFQCPL